MSTELAKRWQKFVIDGRHLYLYRLEDNKIKEKPVSKILKRLAKTVDMRKKKANLYEIHIPNLFIDNVSIYSIVEDIVVLVSFFNDVNNPFYYLDIKHFEYTITNFQLKENMFLTENSDIQSIIKSHIYGHLLYKLWDAIEKTPLEVKQL